VIRGQASSQFAKSVRSVQNSALVSKCPRSTSEKVQRSWRKACNEGEQSKKRLLRKREVIAREKRLACADRGGGGSLLWQLSATAKKTLKVNETGNDVGGERTTEEKPAAQRSEGCVSQVHCGESPKMSPGAKKSSATVKRASVKYWESVATQRVYERRSHNERYRRCI
jgi:hypothetical protein